jgi:hypothetical protein
MVKRPKPASPSWRAFLANHVPSLVSIDFFVVPTVRRHVLYLFVVLAHLRRRIVHFAITEHPTAAWTAQQMMEAFPWDTAPRYLIRDRDAPLRRPLPGPREVDEDRGGPHRAAQSVAIPVRRTADRQPSPRLPRPRRGAQRASPAPSPDFVPHLLPRGPLPHLARRRCAGTPRATGCRVRQRRRDAGGRRLAPSVRPARGLTIRSPLSASARRAPARTRRPRRAPDACPASGRRGQRPTAATELVHHRRPKDADKPSLTRRSPSDPVSGKDNHPSLLRRATRPQAQVAQDLLAHRRLLDDRDQPHGAATLCAAENVLVPHPAEKLTPGETASTPGVVRTGEAVGGVLLRLVLQQISEGYCDAALWGASPEPRPGAGAAPCASGQWTVNFVPLPVSVVNVTLPSWR